jgi:hypothetical protein
MKTKSRIINVVRRVYGTSLLLITLSAMFIGALHAEEECGPNSEGCKECGPHWGSWYLLSCPSQTNTPSVNPTTICVSSGSGATAPTVVPPAYNQGQKQRDGTYDCTNTVNSETNSISYSVGGVQWDPPLPGTLTNDFTSCAYVTVTSSDTNLCPSPGAVLVGCATWKVEVKTTNCLANGFMTLTNGTINTNVCIGTAISASATKVISNAIVRITTQCPGTTNPPVITTNYPAPTLVSNWWVASGPGSYSNSGSGLTASFTPTNGGSGTVTFHLKYKNASPCDTNEQTAASLSLPFNVIQITNQCNAAVPTPRTRTTIGVGELVSLGLVGPPAGTFTWTTSAGTLSTTNGTSTVLTAPERAATATVTVNFTGGSCNKAFTVVEPAGETAVKDHEYTYPAGTQGAGMLLSPITVTPTTVSFARVEVLEVPGGATSVTGYFTNYTATNLWHHPNPSWINLNNLNQWQDTAYFSGYPAPWYAGGFTWVIPVRWRVVGSTNAASLPNRTQVFSILGTNGQSRVSKLGQSATRTP